MGRMSLYKWTWLECNDICIVACCVQAAGVAVDAPGGEADITAAQLHAEMFEDALHSVTPAARALFEKRGKRWQCQPDRWVQPPTVAVFTLPASCTHPGLMLRKHHLLICCPGEALEIPGLWCALQA